MAKLYITAIVVCIVIMRITCYDTLPANGSTVFETSARGLIHAFKTEIINKMIHCPICIDHHEVSRIMNKAVSDTRTEMRARFIMQEKDFKKQLMR